MRVWLWFIGLACGALPLGAATGVVRTVQARTYEGEVRLTAGGVEVQPAGGVAVAVPEADLAQLSLGATDWVPQASLPKGQGNGLLGLYYTTTNLTGNAVLRLDETVHFNWHTDEPLPAFQNESFSVRWMGFLEPPATDTYTFTLGSDDGSRLRVGEEFLLDQWSRHEYAETNGRVRLEAGRKYKLICDYFDLVGNARVSLSWSSGTFARSLLPKDRLYAASFVPEHKAELTGEKGLLATYYAGLELNGRSFSRIDPEVNFQLLGVPPAPELPASRYSIRWTGQVQVEAAGGYTFYTVTDEGCRLWLNDRLVINTWFQPFLIEQSCEVTLAAGQRCDLRFETRDSNGQLIAKLLWSGPGLGKVPLPTRALSPAKPSLVNGTPNQDSLDVPAGATLLNGALIAAPLLSASDAAVRFQGFLKATPVPLTRVARLQLRPLPPEQLAKLPPDRAGVLLKDGDFAEGDFGGLEEGRVKVNSVLYGDRTFENSSGVAVIALRPAPVSSWRWRLKTCDGTQFFVQELRLENGRILLPEILGLSLTLADLEQVSRR